jgi:hypothetical protein
MTSSIATFIQNTGGGGGGGGPENELQFFTAYPTVPPINTTETVLSVNSVTGKPMATWNPATQAWVAMPDENEVIVSAALPVAPPADPTENKIAVSPSGAVLGVWNAATQAWIATPTTDVRAIKQPLVAGNNVITHNLNSVFPEVEVRNDANGALITHRVVAEALNTVTIFVAVAVASARIRIDV